MQLRVAVFTGNYDYTFDGVALTTNRQVAYLERHGVPVRVYAPIGRVRVIESAGTLVPVPSIPIVPPYRLATWLTPAVRRDLEAFRPTLVHLATPDLLGIAAMDWANRRRIPVVATFHTHFCRYLRYYRLAMFDSLVWRLMRWYYRRCDEVHVACDSLADDLRRHGIDANLVVRPFGVDRARFHPSKRSDDWRTRHGIGPADVAVLFVGRLVWEKNLAVFAEVIHRLKHSHKCVVVGDGPAGVELRRRLPQAIFTDRLGGDELATAFASSDVFFFPSASETFGCVTLEAMASGLPCVVADATGSRDLVRDGIDGYVRAADDVGGFTDAVGELAADADGRRRMGAAAVERAVGFDWDAGLERMRADYVRLVQTPRYRRRAHPKHVS